MNQVWVIHFWIIWNGVFACFWSYMGITEIKAKHSIKGSIFLVLAIFSIFTNWLYV